MPRIRTVKPEFWSSEKIATRLKGPEGRMARLLFIALWNFSEDHAVARASPARIKADVFAYDDDVSAQDVARWLLLLEQGGFVRRFEVNGSHYLHVVGLLKHQRIDKPSKPTFPSPPELPPEPSPAAPPAFAEPSASPPGGFLPVVVEEGRGEEGKGEEQEPAAPAVSLDLRSAKHGAAQQAALPMEPDALPAPRVERDQVRQVFEHWQRVMGKDRAKLDAKRERAIRGALKEYPLDDVLRAIDGCRTSAFHMGKNDTRTQHNDLTLILRDAKRLEGFRDLVPEPLAPGERAADACAVPGCPGHGPIAWGVRVCYPHLAAMDGADVASPADAQAWLACHQDGAEVRA